MLARIKIGTAIALGFTAAVLAALVIGLIGWRGVQQTGAAAARLSDARIASAWTALDTGSGPLDAEQRKAREAMQAEVEAIRADTLAAQERSARRLLIALALGVTAVIVLAGCLVRHITLALRRSAAEAARVARAITEGRLDVRGEVDGLHFQLHEVVQGMNGVVEAMAVPLRMSAERVRAMAHGKVPQRIETALHGEYAELAQGWNALIAVVEDRNSDMETLFGAAAAGALGVRADTRKYSGYNGELIQRINALLDQVSAPLRWSAEAVARISRGDIPDPLTVECRGEFDTLRRNLNACIDALRAMIEDANAMSAAIRAGQLGYRADTSRHQGGFRAIVDGYSGAMSYILGSYQGMASYFERISHGEIPERRDDRAGRVYGDMVAIRTNVNRCLETLSALVTDTRALALAATEGRVNARADLSRYEGAFRATLEGVNQTLDAFAAPVEEATQVLEKVAERDLLARVQGDYRGDHARIKDAVNATAQALHDAIAQVADAATQVSDASKQIAASSQMVASGASEQASSLEETSSSLESVASMTRQAADSAQQANGIAQSARAAAAEGATAMEQMHGAMSRIRKSSQDTSQIIRDINDIAFQTNLLSLNAAVEAARAGEAGRGFAVVAEEVRSLALRAKEAAGKTEELIRQSVKEADDGERTASQVAQRLGEIVGGVSKVSEIVSEIAAASREQTSGIDHVSRAVSEMDKVTQQNAASAEESSSAASELNGQAEELSAMVDAFRTDRSAKGLSRARGQRAARPGAPRLAAVASPMAPVAE